MDLEGNKHKNLIPFNQRTEEERREIARAGGIASGVARRRKRSMKSAADLYLSMPVSNKKKSRALVNRGLASEDVDNQMAVIVGITDAAVEGDARAAKLLMDIVGPMDDDTVHAGESGGVLVVPELQALEPPPADDRE